MSTGNYSPHSPLQANFAGGAASRNTDTGARTKYRASNSHAASGHRSRMSSGGITEEDIYGHRAAIASRIPLGGRGRSSFDQETAGTALGSNGPPSTLTRKSTRTRNGDTAGPSSPGATGMPPRSRASLPVQASQITPPSSQRQRQQQQQQQQYSAYAANSTYHGHGRSGHSRGSSDMGIYAFSDSNLASFPPNQHDGPSSNNNIYGSLNDDLDMLKELDAIQQEADLHIDLQSQLLARHRGIDDNDDTGKKTPPTGPAAGISYGYRRTESPVPDPGEASDTTNDDGFAFLDRRLAGSSGLRNEQSLGSHDEFLFDLHAEQPPWMVDSTNDPPSPTFGAAGSSGGKSSGSKKKSTDKSRRKKLSVSTNFQNDGEPKERSARSPKSSSSTRSKQKQGRSELRSPRSAAIRDRPPTPAPADMADGAASPDDDANDIQDIAMLPPSAVQHPDATANAPAGQDGLDVQITMTTASPDGRHTLDTSDNRPFSPLPPESPLAAPPAEVRQQLRERLREQHIRMQAPTDEQAAAPETAPAGSAQPAEQADKSAPTPSSASRHRPSTSRDTFMTNTEETVSMGFSTHSTEDHEQDGAPSIASSQHSDSMGLSGDTKQKRSAASAAKAAVRRISQMASPFRSSKSGAPEEKKKGNKKKQAQQQQQQQQQQQPQPLQQSSSGGSQRSGAASPTSASQIPVPISGASRSTSSPPPAASSSASAPPVALGGKPVHVYEAEIAKLNAELAGRGAVIEDMRAQLNRTFDDVRASQNKAHEAERQVAQLSSENDAMKKEREELMERLGRLEEEESNLAQELSEVKAELAAQVEAGKQHEESTLGLQGEKQGARAATLIEKNSRLKETIELLKKDVQEAKAGERQRAEANNDEISILMEKITQLQNTNSSLLVDNEKLRTEAEQLRQESDESTDKKEVARLTEEYNGLKEEHADMSRQLASERIEKERALEETDILSNNIKRMRAALEGVTEENDGLHAEIESLRAELDHAVKSATKSSELEFYKDQFARLAAENDELKRALDKTTAQLQVARDSATAAAADSYRGRPTAYEERGHHTRSNSRSSRNWSMDIPSTPAGASLRSDQATSISGSPVRDRFMFTSTPDVDTMSSYSGGSGHEARSTTTTEERPNVGSSANVGAGAGANAGGARYDYRLETSPDTPATSVGSARNSPQLNQRRFSGSFRTDERTIEEWNEDLQRLLAEKERLQADYSRIPLTGGGAAMRRRKENLEAKMDEVDKELSGVKTQIKCLNPF
ncbi:hypothetical protein SYNPS1DRAFT_27630 [Syncephalis pseudoplumigaleata]|uniref:Enkurin domain-containing protein n=1 Tax=Syncephalis pseudoplumigaleata TaxID=1712513 RepID=A0A4P9Z3T3_9FUNG|nr:hypothetical protein SYNPS1DRAFT_27630 [Syncephalis pseudoplumigaleata]|eukprot:RKP26692.1 hypothetical protein SYNPS1DRAFT_27630 [Syncephalis pseudoplumigaleata]